jgi:putative membrane protein
MLISIRPYWPRILRQIQRPLAFDIAFASIVTLAHQDGAFRFLEWPALPVSLLGAALGIVLGFRTNSAYDRWWEARILWGALVNWSRTFARQMLSFTSDRQFADKMVRCQIAYVHALRCHLRREDPWEDLARYLSPSLVATLRREQNVPAALLHHMGLQIGAHAQDGRLGEHRLHRLDQTLSELINVQGGCERINNTPLPRQYDYFPELFIYIYCLLFPLSVVQDLRAFTPLLSSIITFVFLILNRIGKNLEEPFASRVYGTPLLAISRTIEINLLQQLGETDLPEPIQPSKGVLD